MDAIRVPSKDSRTFTHTFTHTFIFTMKYQFSPMSHSCETAQRQIASSTIFSRPFTYKKVPLFPNFPNTVTKLNRPRKDFFLGITFLCALHKRGRRALGMISWLYGGLRRRMDPMQLVLLSLETSSDTGVTRDVSTRFHPSNAPLGFSASTDCTGLVAKYFIYDNISTTMINCMIEITLYCNFLPYIKF